MPFICDAQGPQAAPMFLRSYKQVGSVRGPPPAEALEIQSASRASLTTTFSRYCMPLRSSIKGKEGHEMDPSTSSVAEEHLQGQS